MSGYSGFAAKGVHYGIGPQGVVVQLTGQVAQLGWREVFELAEGCSRIDMQFTVNYGRDPQEVITLHDEEARAYANRLKRPPSVRLIDHNVKGKTLYLGERVSTYFGRVYDKGRESKVVQYQGCTRYELQVNGDRALWTAGRLHGEKSSFTSSSAQASYFFRKRGLQDVPVCPHKLYSTSRTPPDELSRLAWLSKSVRPSIQKLIDSGLLFEVLDSLGLLDHVSYADDRSCGWSNNSK